jgi:acyl carrier protein
MGVELMSEQSQQIISYLLDVVIRRPGVSIDESTPLVSSGLLDSFALVDVLLKLEDITQLRIPAGKVQPKDMDTVQLMFETAARVGKPRKK